MSRGYKHRKGTHLSKQQKKEFLLEENDIYIIYQMKKEVFYLINAQEEIKAQLILKIK